MGLPSASVVTLNSGSATISGNKDFSITMKMNDDGFTLDDNYDIRVLEYGTIEMNIDVPEDADNINEFLYTVPSFTFKISSYITPDLDIGDILKQLVREDLIEVHLDYAGTSSMFICQKTDISYNLIEKTAEVTCYSPFKYAEQISAYSTGARIRTAIWENDLGTDFEYNVITQRDLIEAYLDTLDNTLTQKIQSNFTIDSSAASISSGSIGLTSYVTDNEGNSGTGPEGSLGTFVVDSFSDARDKVLQCGIAEAAIIGTAFGESFYVRRDYSGADSGYSSTIDISELEEFNVEFAAKSVSNLTVTIGGEENTIGASFGGQRVEITIGDFADQTLLTYNTSYTPPYLLEVDGVAGSGEESYANLSTDAFNSYEKVFTLQDTVKFKGVIRGTIDKVRPYYYLEFNENISGYLDSTNNKIRMSRVVYNLDENNVEFEGYSI